MTNRDEAAKFLLTHPNGSHWQAHMPDFVRYLLDHGLYEHDFALLRESDINEIVPTQKTGRVAQQLRAKLGMSEVEKDAPANAGVMLHALLTGAPEPEKTPSAEAQAERFLALGKTTFRDREERDEPLPEPANLLVKLKILAFDQLLARDQDEYQFEITPLGKRVAANLASALKARGIKTFWDLPEVDRALGPEVYEIRYKQRAEMEAALVCDGTLLDAALEKAQREEAQAQREEAQARKAQSARAAVSPAKPVYQPHPDSVGERLKDTVAMIGMAAIVGLLILVLVSGG